MMAGIKEELARWQHANECSFDKDFNERWVFEKIELVDSLLKRQQVLNNPY